VRAVVERRSYRHGHVVQVPIRDSHAIPFWLAGEGQRRYADGYAALSWLTLSWLTHSVRGDTKPRLLRTEAQD
jgi:hypothetical protein